MILGDNIFFGHGLPARLQEAARLQKGALIFAYSVRDPQHYGVVEFDESGKAISIEEKPHNPRSSYAIPGLYFFDNQVVELSRNLKPSARDELEITDLIKGYLQQGLLRVEILGRGVAWLDAGTHETLLQSANFIQTVEQRQGMMISCPEEIAYRLGYIDADQVYRQAKKLSGNEYGNYLLHLLEGPTPFHKP